VALWRLDGVAVGAAAAVALGAHAAVSGVISGGRCRSAGRGQRHSAPVFNAGQRYLSAPCPV